MKLEALPPDQVLDIPFPSYHKPLELARILARSGETSGRDSAAKLLQSLTRRYPHILAIGQEFVFVLMEQDLRDEAEAALRDFEKKFPTLDEEFLCRWGRLFKERGDAHTALPWAKVDAGNDPILAERYYRKSLEKYDQAYRIRESYYPGINKATVLLILGALKTRMNAASARPEQTESADLAGKILESRSRWRPAQPDDEPIWFPATAAEAHLLRQEWAEAAAQYREAVRAKKESTAHSRETMRRQVERILLCFESLGTAIPKPFDDIGSLFGVMPEAMVPAR